MDAWNKLGEDIIEKSFKVFVLNLNIDGWKDFPVHCFKQDQPCVAGYEKLQQQLHVLKDSTFKSLQLGVAFLYALETSKNL